MLLDEGPELPRCHAVTQEVGGGHDGSRAHAVVDERDLPEVVAGTERGAVLSADRDLGVALRDHEEARSGRAFRRDLCPLGEAAFVQLPPELVEVAVVEPAEERDVPQGVDRGTHRGDHRRTGRSSGQSGEVSLVRTQAALYDEIDLELSWSETELPERERTKHVHRLHPYLGKYVPQLVEVFLGRYGHPGRLVWDPFAGSGTTLVEANAFGASAAGCDISAFNCLLTRVKAAAYEPEALRADAALLADTGRRDPRPGELSPYLRSWFAPQALGELLAFRDALDGTAYPDLWRVVLS